MKANTEKENEYIYDKEFKLLRAFIKSFNYSDSQEKNLNSTKIRHLINSADSPCISPKTFDSAIRLLNEKLTHSQTNINPVFQTQIDSKTPPLHTNVFYHRLAFCLNLNLYEKELYSKQLEDNAHRESREKFNLIFGLQCTDTSPSYVYTFDIHNFYMPPFFAPLFIGIIGSLKKEKTSWQKLREKALEISESFYNEKHQEINQFLPENADIRRDLYTYWLELHFPDELFDLVSEYDNLMHEYNDSLLLHNLDILADELSKDIFLTRINQKKLIQQIKATLELYLNTPLINPETNEPRNLNLCDEYTQTSNKYHLEEIHLLREWEAE